MKKILICALVAMLSLSLMAQDEVTQKPKSLVHYQGEFTAGYSHNFYVYYYSITELQTIHGIRIGDYFSTGLGLGFDISTASTMTIFANVRGYLPVSKVTRLFLNLDFGTVICLDRYVPITPGPAPYLSPSIGASFKVSPKSAVNVGLVYKTYFDVYRTNSLGIRVGFQF